MRRYFRDLCSFVSTLAKIDRSVGEHGFALSDVPNEETAAFVLRSRQIRIHDAAPTERQPASSQARAVVVSAWGVLVRDSVISANVDDDPAGGLVEVVGRGRWAGEALRRHRRDPTSVARQLPANFDICRCLRNLPVVS